MRDSACSSKLSLGYAVDLIFNQSVDAIIGPPCSDGESSDQLTLLPLVCKIFVSLLLIRI